MITVPDILIVGIIVAMAGIIALIVRSYRHDLTASPVAATDPGGQHTAAKAATHHDAGPAPAAGAPASGLDTAALEQMAKATFEQAVNDSASQFKQEVHGSSQRLSDLIVRLTTNVVEKELEVYRAELASARGAALKSLETMQVSIEAKQQELERGIDKELAAHKQRLLERLDARLGTAAAAYIVESLGQGADLGAQRNYLLESLERHKADLKKDLNDEL